MSISDFILKDVLAPVTLPIYVFARQIVFVFKCVALYLYMMVMAGAKLGRLTLVAAARGFKHFGVPEELCYPAALAWAAFWFYLIAYATYSYSKAMQKWKEEDPWDTIRQWPPQGASLG